MKKLLDYIFFLRPMLIVPMWTIMLLGMRAAELGDGAGPFIVSDFLNDPGIYALIFLITLLFGAIYAYNQVFDIQSDRENGKLFFLSDDIIPVSVAKSISYLFLAVAVIAAFFVNVPVGVLFAISAVLGVLYSHPLTNFKGKSGKALWSNMFGCGTLPFLIGWAYIQGSFNMEAVLKSMPYFVAVGAIYLNTTLPDRDGDRKVGKETYGVIWTISRTQSSALMRIIIAVMLAVMAGDYAATAGAVLALPFFIMAVVRKTIADSVNASIAAILALSLMACIYIPVYIAILAIAVLATRAYYKWRFDMDYPAFKKSA